MDTGSPQWLTREKDVVSHLFFAAAEIGAIEVDVGGRAYNGTMTFPTLETRSFTFFVTDDDPTEAEPAEGTVVRVRYSRGESSYSYLTALSKVPERSRWMLEFPRTIERNQRRIAGRHRVMGQGGFRVRIDGGAGVQRSLPLYDLSTAGLGFVFTDEDLDVKIGRSLAGNLCLPDGSNLPLLIEVRSVRPMPTGRAEKIAGCTFVGLASSDHAVLARALAQWGQRR